MQSPCTWPISYLACADQGPLATMSAEDRALVEGMATAYLWNWTARSFGLCTVAVRPCRTGCAQERMPTFEGWGPYAHGSASNYGPWPNPQLTPSGEWTNVSCGRSSCGDGCSCTGALSQIELPGPVAAVTEVLIDGTVLAPSAYRVDNGRYLVRLDGQPWPYCQDMTLPSTEVGTFQITYTRGREVPGGGQLAAGALAVELAKALCKDSSCKLPARVQSITRQGVTIAVLDPGEGLDNGQTGIWAIDSWVSSITRPPRAATVISPDYGRTARFRTTTTS